MTYSDGHRGLPVQLHPVEGMTSGEIIDRMVSVGGVERARILRDIVGRTAKLGDDRHFVRDTLERGVRRKNGGGVEARVLGGRASDEWSVAELSTLVRSYLEKLSFQEKNIGFRQSEHISDLRDQSFRARSIDELKLAMRCVSAVLAQRSFRWLVVYTPAAPLPEAMAIGIGEILTEHGFAFVEPQRLLEDDATSSGARSADFGSPDPSDVPVGNLKSSPSPCAAPARIHAPTRAVLRGEWPPDGRSSGGSRARRARTRGCPDRARGAGPAGTE